MECSSGIRTGSKEKEHIMLCVYFKIFSEGWSMAYKASINILRIREIHLFSYTNKYNIT